MADTFGDARKFTMETREVDKAGPGSGKIAMSPPTRSLDSFSAAALECALSRVYLGIHFRYDSLAGNELGRRVGAYAIRKYLVPVALRGRPPASRADAPLLLRRRHASRARPAACRDARQVLHRALTDRSLSR